jgi:hypothetical protein
MTAELAYTVRRFEARPQKASRIPAAITCSTMRTARHCCHAPIEDVPCPRPAQRE